MNDLSDDDIKYIENQTDEAMDVIQKEWIFKFCELKKCDPHYASAVVSKQIMLNAFMLFGQSLGLEFDEVNDLYKETMDRFRNLRIRK